MLKLSIEWLIVQNIAFMTKEPTQHCQPLLGCYPYSHNKLSIGCFDDIVAPIHELQLADSNFPTISTIQQTCWPRSNSNSRRGHGAAGIIWRGWSAAKESETNVWWNLEAMWRYTSFHNWYGRLVKRRTEGLKQQEVHKQSSALSCVEKVPRSLKQFEESLPRTYLQ